MTIKEEIMVKVKEREKSMGKFERCLAAHICPECGEELAHYEDQIMSCIYFTCHSCHFNHKQW